MKRIGLIAGNGKFPFLFADHARKNGAEIVAVGLKSEADPELQKHVDKFYWSSIGNLSNIINILKREQITQAVMAGQVKHNKIYLRLILDKRALSILRRIKDKRTDSILKAVADEFKSEGIEFLPSTAFLKDYLAGPGVFTISKPSKEESEDIAFGYIIAKQLSSLDIGQTAIVKDKSVVALEALEGTDQCILRSGELLFASGGRKGIVVVKVSKPKQDLRFDVPVLGSKTIESLIKANARVLAFEAGKTMFMDMEEVIRKADENNICIIGIEG